MKRRSERWCLMRTVAVNYASAGTSPNVARLSEKALFFVGFLILHLS